MKIEKLSLAQLDPASFAAYNEGNRELALRMCGQMMKLAPTNSMYAMRYAYFADGVEATSFDQDIKRAVSTCLKVPDIEYQKLGNLWASLALTNPAYPFLFDIKNDSAKIFGKIEILLQDEFFILGLKNLIPINGSVEKALTRLRKSLIAANNRLKLKHLPLLCALAEQCFYNEYVWSMDEDEENFIKTFLPHNPLTIALAACYKPLHEYSDATDWLKTHTQNPLAHLLQIQVANFLEEKDIAHSLNSFSAIKGRTSLAVQDMYEENPYPRWHTMDIPRQNYPEADLDWLVAGCGTGRSLVQMTTCFPNARLTAIDLSKASLAYAKRQIKQYGIENIEFMQGDIAEVTSIDKSFDFIESSGVLHHMKDPMEGWRALLTRLRPGGRMQIGLYSQSARRDIFEVREYIKRSGYGADIQGIRKLRDDLLALPDGHELKRATQRRDFYTTSECRDLLFHVQEHNYTLLDLENMLDTLDLAFLGFKTSVGRLNLYAQRFPADPLMRNLKNWNILEGEHPQLFIGMYVFFCCRKDEIDIVNQNWVSLDQTNIMTYG
jgi:SAM-dependent methyltransferase